MGKSHPQKNIKTLKHFKAMQALYIIIYIFFESWDIGYKKLLLHSELHKMAKALVITILDTASLTRLVASLFTHIAPSPFYNLSYQSTDRLVHISHAIAAVQLMSTRFFSLFFIWSAPFSLNRLLLKVWWIFVCVWRLDWLQCPHHKKLFIPVTKTMDQP